MCFNFSKDWGPIDVCILAAPADDTLLKLIPLMSSKSFIFTQTRITSKRTLQIIEKRGISLGRAFSSNIDDLIMSNWYKIKFFSCLMGNIYF